MEPDQWRNALPPDVREVLQTGITLGPPTGSKQAIWSALASKLPAATAGAAAGGVTALTILKPLAVGLALGAVTAVGALEIRSAIAPPSSVSASALPPSAAPVEPRPRLPTPSAVPELASTQPAPSAIVKPAASPVSADGVALAVPSALIEERASSAAPSGVAAFPETKLGMPPEDATLRESRRLNQARSALQSGNARSALTQLDALAAEFPNGVLEQERDALRIEALLGLGDRKRARALAEQFISRYPRSPHAAAVGRALQ